MTLKSYFRMGAVALFAALVAGCGTSSPDTAGATRKTASVASPSIVNKCRWSPGSCMHEGSYESGERQYAEEEARRLNQAVLQRMRTW